MNTGGHFNNKPEYLYHQKLQRLKPAIFFDLKRLADEGGNKLQKGD